MKKAEISHQTIKRMIKEYTGLCPNQRFILFITEALNNFVYKIADETKAEWEKQNLHKLLCIHHIPEPLYDFLKGGEIGE